MKSYAVLGLATMFGATNADAQIPQVQGLFDGASQTDEEKMTDAVWYINGVKGFYEGYYKAFYKTSKKNEYMSDCLNKKTVDNLVAIHSVVSDPMSLFGGDVSKDIDLFS